MMDVKIFDNDTEAGKYAFDLIKQGMDNGAKVLGYRQHTSHHVQSNG